MTWVLSRTLLSAVERIDLVQLQLTANMGRSATRSAS
jgi:hypothetical protein